MMLEKEIQNQILCFLDECGLNPRIIKTMGTFNQKANRFIKSHNRFAKNGMPDIMAFMPDCLLFVEVKAKRGIVSDDQRTTIIDLQNSKQIAFVSRSVEQTYDQLEKFWPQIQNFKHLLRNYT